MSRTVYTCTCIVCACERMCVCMLVCEREAQEVNWYNTLPFRSHLQCTCIYTGHAHVLTCPCVFIMVTVFVLLHTTNWSLIFGRTCTLLTVTSSCPERAGLNVFVHSVVFRFHICAELQYIGEEGERGREGERRERGWRRRRERGRDKGRRN